MLSEKDKLTRVLQKRNALIDALDHERISKQEFLRENYALLQRMQMKPFRVIDCLQKGLYNYQYFNTMAKHTALQRMQAISERKRSEYGNAISNFYHLKDACILEILRLDHCEPIEAYYVETNSKSLSEQLIEIVFTSREKMIFHTVNAEVQTELERMGVFTPKTKRSLIHEYINTSVRDDIRKGRSE